MANTLTVFADGDVSERLQAHLRTQGSCATLYTAHSFAECVLIARKIPVDALVLQLQVQSNVAACLDFMYDLDHLAYSPAMLLFEKLDERTITFTTTDATLNPSAAEISCIFQAALEGAYQVNFALFRPAILEQTLLKDSVLGREEALSEIMRGSSEEEIELYKKFYRLDLRDHGYYLFFWELQHTEYQNHYYNKDVYNFMGSILEKKYQFILEQYEGGEEFRLSLDRRCIIINDLTAKSEAFKYEKREEMLRQLVACGNCKTASCYISERVESLRELRFIRDQYETDKSNTFFLRHEGVIRAKDLRLLRRAQKVDMEAILLQIQKIRNYICYDISNPNLDAELHQLYFHAIKPSMSYALYYYCVTAICSELMKADQHTDLTMLAETLTPELLRFSSVEEQYDTILKYINTFRQQDGDRWRSRNSIVARAKEYIEKHYSEDISVPEIAAALYVSHMYLSQLFRAATGTSVINYLVHYRIQQAQELLEKTDCAVYHVAEAVGFHDIKHFSKTFKNIVGISPTVYRKQLRSGTDRG